MISAWALLLAGTAFAADFNPNSPGFWRRPAQVDQQDSLTVIVLKVDDVTGTQKKLEELCEKFDCTKGERPSWYYTGYRDLRTAYESYHRVKTRKKDTFEKRLMGLGEILQFKKIPMRNKPSPELEDEFAAKERHLSKEKTILEGRAPGARNIINLVDVELDILKDIRQKIEESKKFALVNVRLTSDKTY